MTEYLGIKVGDKVKIGDYNDCEVNGFFYRGEELQIAYILKGSQFSMAFNAVPICISNPIIKYSKEVSDFIEANAAKSEQWYWFPYYFKKVGEDLFELLTFQDLPDSLKHIVEQSEPREPKEDEV